MTYYKMTNPLPSPELLTSVAGIFKSGGIVCHPTETVYGLAVRWDSNDGIHRLSELKGRAPDKPYSLLVHSTNQIMEMLGWRTDRLEQLLQALYPAPVTLILPHRNNFDVAFWNQFPNLGFRLPDHVLSRELATAAGAPIITTSANTAGTAPPVSAEEIEAQIRSGVDLLIDAGPCRDGLPSTIIGVDLDAMSFACYREGKFSIEAFEILFQSL